ncbi:hypothetical protein Bbelb_308990 [Branchiostoma belcheri]|nr:hypothetical protein Bbelb_308990 [Branchiostoma belcheri]
MSDDSDHYQLCPDNSAHLPAKKGYEAHVPSGAILNLAFSAAIGLAILAGKVWIGGSVRTGEVAIDRGKSSSDPPLKDRTIGSEVVVMTIRGLPSCDYFDRL